ncbi:YafY family protein [Rhizobium sp. L1K21]|uniref:helix-turn-helix transcriptional regulator n=1 Tax=Rhizobium sp. L1K21 TaxID=2954933 RepID=UPI0020938EAE|nr:WYL domain-containing protein [Rhizobium sp. L1K21]MCO6184827.1 WYL domain-containing protein [Rhizobium sp. L1K21]
MKRATTSDRLERLDVLEARLKSAEPLVLKDLAAEFAISLRTISRDIEILRERGLPIEAERGRGGGVRLSANWGVGRISLNYREAVGLLVSLAVIRQMKSPLLMSNLSSVRRKLVASFSRADQSRIRALQSRIIVGQTVSPFVLSNYSVPPDDVVGGLHEAFLLNRAIEISYLSEKGEVTERVIEPHFLLLNYPAWYTLAFDHLRGAPRTFRCDRMQSLTMLDATFQPRPVTDFAAALEGVEIISDGTGFSI